MRRVNVYMEDVSSLKELRNIRTAVYDLLDRNITLLVRGYFRTVETHELVFDGTWFTVQAIGNKHINLYIDGEVICCEPYDTFNENPKFDVMISERR